MKIINCIGSLLLPVVIMTQLASTFAAEEAIMLSAKESIVERGSASTEDSHVVSTSLYQVNFSSRQPICNLIIGEYSTGQIIAAWRPASQVSAPGKYYIIATSGELLVLIIHNSDNGSGQLLSLISRYANRLRIRIDYPDMTYEEVLPNLPFILNNCSLETAESCVAGTTVSDPYQSCNPSVSGFVEIIVTDAGGSWDKFKKNVVSPLQKAQEWLPSDVWLHLYQKVNKGYYAEVRITTNKCLRMVAEKLQGNPTILSSNGRQLNIHYR